MKGINGELVGRWSLRLDAAYCAVLGIAVLVNAPALASAIALPAVVIGGVGIAVVLWAAVVLWLLARLRLRSALRLVMAANLVAALGVAGVSTGGRQQRSWFSPCWRSPSMWRSSPPVRHSHCGHCRQQRVANGPGSFG